MPDEVRGKGEGHQRGARLTWLQAEAPPRRAFEALTAPGVTQEDRLQLRKILQDALGEQRSPATLADEIQANVPSLGKLLDLVIPRTSGDFYAMLAALLFLLQWLLAQKQVPHAVPIEVHQHFNIMLEQNPDDASAASEVTKDAGTEQEK